MLVDDHAVVREGLAALISEDRGLVVCGDADCERVAIDKVRRLQPDVVVVDWMLGNRDAADLVEILRAEYPHLPLLVLSMHEEALFAERALRAGASGYVMKQAAADRIIEAIHCVLNRRCYLSVTAEQSVTTATRAQVEQALSGLPKNTPDPVDSALRPAVEFSGCPTVSIVIPVFNSEATIGRLVGELVAELNNSYRLQIVLVDDGSTDGSAHECQRIQSRNPDVVDFVTLSRNFGEHNAVMAGINCAEGDYCVIMDDDFQNPPGEVHRLIDEIRKGHDVVYVRYKSKRHSWFRNAGSRFHNWVATRSLGKPSSLYLSSFKAMTHFLVREAIHFRGPDPYLDAIILRTTRKIGVVEARHEERQKGKSGYTLGKLISLWGNMIVPFSLYPLRLLGLYGLVMTLIGSGYGIYTVIAYFTTLFPDPNPLQQLSASMWFFRGVHLLAIAIVGEYVGRIYRQLNRDPQFIIRSVLRHRRDN